MVAILYQYRKYFIPSLLIFFFAVFYSRFLFDYPGTSGDSIKFQYLGYVLGVPHPSGYPLYMGLNYVFSHLPISTLAFRSNLLSMVFGLLSLGLFYGLIFRLTKRSLLAFALTLFLGVTGSFWTYTCLAEVYSLHWFLFLAILCAVTWWTESPSANRLGLVVLFLTIGMLHHQHTVTVIPGVIFLLWKNRKAISFESTLRNSIAVAIFLFVIIHWLWYLRTQSTLFYMDFAIPDFSAYAAYITGGTYKSFLMGDKSAAAFFLGLWTLTANLLLEWKLCFFVLFFVVLLTSLFRKNDLSSFFLITFFAWFLSCSQYNNVIICQYYAQGTVLAGLIIASVFSTAAINGIHSPSSFTFKGTSFLAAFVCLIPALVTIRSTPQELSIYKNMQPQLMEEILKEAPQDSVIIPNEYRNEQLLLYYSVIHKEWRHFIPYFITAEGEIASYLRDKKPFICRGKVIPAGKRLFSMADYDKYNPAYFTYTPLPHPAGSILAEDITERVAKWPSGKIIAVTSNNKDGFALSGAITRVLKQFDVGQEFTANSNYIFTGVFRMEENGSARGKYTLCGQLSITGVEPGEILHGKPVPVRIESSSVETGAIKESYIAVNGIRYLANCHGVSFLVINEKSGMVEYELTVNPSVTTRIYPYELREMKLK